MAVLLLSLGRTLLPLDLEKTVSLLASCLCSDWRIVAFFLCSCSGSAVKHVLDIKKDVVLISGNTPVFLYASGSFCWCDLKDVIRVRQKLTSINLQNNVV